MREFDERLGFGKLIAPHLTDPLRGKNTHLPLADLLRQSVHSCTAGYTAGYEDVNDAERLSQDPTFRLIGSENIWERGAALTPRLRSFDTELLAQEENLAGLAAINRELITKLETIDSSQQVALDMDSTEIRYTASRRTAPITDTSSPAISHSCCSTARESVWQKSCDPAMSTAPRAGMSFCYLRSNGTRTTAKRWRSGPRLQPYTRHEQTGFVKKNMKRFYFVRRI